MALYDTVLQEKKPIVLEIGTAYTKLGCAAEAYPRKIIPSELILSSDCTSKSLFDYKNTTELYDQMVDFLQMIFFKHLQMGPKESKVVVVENVFGKTEIRDTLARVLFKHFEVSSVLFVPAHMIALSTLAIATAMVVDIGYSGVSVMPVYSGVQIMKAFQDHSYGSKMVHEEIKRQLLEKNINDEYLTEDVLEDIKVRTCFVTTFERAASYRNHKPPKEAESVEYPIRDEHIITIPGQTREQAFEIMFEESNEQDNLAHLILRAAVLCPRDLRQALLSNILIMGGGAIIMGLQARLKAELEHLLKTNKEYSEKFHKDIKFKFHKTIGRQNILAWMGGSLCAGTDLINSRALAKETYLRNEHVPDWNCLTDNRLLNS